MRFDEISYMMQSFLIQKVKPCSQEPIFRLKAKGKDQIQFNTLNPGTKDFENNIGFTVK